MKYILSLLLSIIPTSVHAGSVAITGPYSGLNDSNASITLDDSDAQDLLNVEATEDGSSLKKRSGYSLFYNLPVATASVSGGGSFKTISGKTIVIMAHDIYVSASADGAAFTSIITSGVAGAKWRFCESSGKIFAFNDGHTTPWSYDGDSLTYYPSMPKASLCAITPTRMLLAGTTDFPNRLYFSEAGNYTNFTVDIEPESPSFDDIGMAGDRITALFANSSEWLIAKVKSIISYQGTNQYDLVASVVSNTVGISDPGGIAEYQNSIYIKATDGKIWGYTSGNLLDISPKIDVFCSGITQGTIIDNEYDTSLVWGEGTFSNTYIDGTMVKASTWSNTDDTSANWTLGGLSDVSTITADGSVVSSSIFSNSGFESNSFTNWTNSGFTIGAASYFGSYQARSPSGTSGPAGFIQVLDSGDSVLLNYAPDTYAIPHAIDTSTLPAQIKLRFTGNGGTLTSVLFANPRKIVAYGQRFIGIGSVVTYMYDVAEPNYFSSGTYTSQIFNTGFTKPIGGQFAVDYTTTTDNSLFFYVRSSTSPNNDMWTQWNPTTSTLQIGATLQYWQYKADFNTSYSSTTPTLNSLTLSAAATGYWESSIATLASMSSWGLFLANEETDALNHWSYQMRASTWSPTLVGATYGTVTPNANITITTGTYAQVKAYNTFTSATETVKLKDIVYNYIYYYSSGSTLQAETFFFDGNVYISVPYGSSLTNNRVMKLDTTSPGWYIFDIPMNSPVVVGQYVYFGSPTGGYVYRYPSGNSDNGSAINSYWKSKDFFGDNAYVEKQYERLSMVVGSNSGSTLTSEYTIDTSSSTSYTISLTSATSSYIRNNRQLPFGNIGQLINLKIGNNAADKPWSFYGANIDYTNNPWRVAPEE